MDYNSITNMKNENEKATAFYDGREVFIRKTFDYSGLVEVLDLASGDIYTVHSSKLNESLNSVNSFR